MTTINEGGTTRSRRLRIRVTLDRELTVGESVHLRRSNTNLGAGTVISPMVLEWVDTVTGPPPGGEQSYVARFLPVSGSYMDSSAHVVVIDDDLLACVMAVSLPPVQSEITLVEVETSLGAQAPDLVDDISGSFYVSDPVTLHSGEVLWYRFTPSATSFYTIDTGASPSGNDSALVLYGPSGEFLVYNDDGWGDDGDNDNDYRAKINYTLQAGVSYYIGLSQYEMITTGDGWNAVTNGTSEWPNTVLRIS